MLKQYFFSDSPIDRNRKYKSRFVYLILTTCPVDNGTHEEGENELGQEHHAGHDGNIRSNTSNLQGTLSK